MTIRVLFVCLGNICRSPMAEAVFQDLVNQAGLTDEFDVASAGTGSYHVGEKPHPSTLHVLAQHGISHDGRARQVTAADMARANSYIVGLDEANVEDLQRAYGRKSNIYLLLDFARNVQERNVPDPYYSGNFEYVYQLVLAGCQGLLETIRQENGL